MFSLNNYFTRFQFNKTNSDIEAPFWDLILSIANSIVSSKHYDKRVYFDFDIVNFPFLPRMEYTCRGLFAV